MHYSVFRHVRIGKEEEEEEEPLLHFLYLYLYLCVLVNYICAKKVK